MYNLDQTKSLVVYSNTTDFSKPPDVTSTALYLILLALHINIICGILTYNEVRQLKQRVNYMEKSFFDAGRMMYSLTYQMKGLLHDIMDILGSSTRKRESKLISGDEIDV